MLVRVWGRKGAEGRGVVEEEEEEKGLVGVWERGSAPADLEGGGRHGRELGGDGEDAVEFAVGEGRGHFGGDAGEDSVVV